MCLAPFLLDISMVNPFPAEKSIGGLNNDTVSKIDFPLTQPSPLGRGKEDKNLCLWCPRACDLKAVRVIGIVLTFVLIFSCGNTEEGGKEGGQSHSPVISSVTIKPANPLSSSTLKAVVKPQQTGTEYTYRWLVNGEEVLHETETTLESEHFSKGDTVEVEVTPSQNEVSGKAEKSEPVVIINSAPAMMSLTIEPSPAHSNDDLTARLDAVDPDDDYIRIAYQWEKNKEDIAGEPAATLSKDHFKKGDTIGCRVTISDDDSDEVSYYSGEITILNSAPTITSQLSGRNMEGYLFTYRVVAEDPDGDPLEFSLDGAPEGVIIDPSTGAIRWEAGEDQRKGTYDFEVVVSDPEGARAIQSINLTFPDTAS